MKLRFSSSAPLQMYFSLVSFLPKVKIFSFWPKTMDYSQVVWPIIEHVCLRSFTPRWRVL